MQLWLDTTNRHTVAQGIALGLVEGITTNPSILGTSKEPAIEQIQALLEMQPCPVAVQVVGDSGTAMIEEAKLLRRLSTRILIKVPLNEAGLVCMHALKQAQIPFLATTIFTLLQALLAYKAGAAYLAPYVGRIRDEGRDPWEMLQSLVKMKADYGFSSTILAAGLRTPLDVEQCVRIGLCGVTVRDSIFHELFRETEGVASALKKFKQDWILSNHTFFEANR